MPDDTLRTFIAIPVPAPVTALIDRVQSRLKRMEMNVRWVPSGNAHLTLKFLGAIDATRVAGIAEKLDPVAATIRPFSLQAAGVGVFPTVRQARVFWIGLQGDIEPLMRLQRRIDESLALIGFKTDHRPFRAHLTIGRPRRRLSAETVQAALAPLRSVTSDAFPVDRVVLYRSTLNPTGATYTRLHAASFDRSGEGTDNI